MVVDHSKSKELALKKHGSITEESHEDYLILTIVRTNPTKREA